VFFKNDEKTGLIQSEIVKVGVSRLLYQPHAEWIAHVPIIRLVHTLSVVHIDGIVIFNFVQFI
jgi:hypothetical protein